MAEGAGLLNQYAGDRIVGSNPTLSAKSCMSRFGIEMGRKPKGAVAFVRKACDRRPPADSLEFALHGKPHRPSRRRPLLLAPMTRNSHPLVPILPETCMVSVDDGKRGGREWTTSGRHGGRVRE